MLPLLLSVVFFAIFAPVIAFVLYKKAQPRRISLQIGTPVLSAPAGFQSINQARPGAFESFARKLGTVLPSNPDQTSLNREDLVCAGYRSDSAPAAFAGIRIFAAVVAVAAGFLMRNVMPANPVLRIALILGSGGLGFVLPRFGLNKIIAKRQEKLRLSLPDALDLLVISVEAGLGMDQAINYLARELRTSSPVLADELNLMSLEMRAGKRRADAMANLATRTGEIQVRRLVSVLSQTDKFGTSVAQALRSHSESMRIERRQQAEERAAKIGVKLVFPIFFFILPSMLVISVGPGMLGLFKHLFPMMQQFKG